MNKVQLVGRTTKDIEVRYTTGQNPIAVAHFNLAISRRKNKDEADFISCTAFGKTAENMEKYVKKGHRVGIVGHIQTGSYEKDGHKVYTTDVIVEELEFLEPKHDEQLQQSASDESASDEGFQALKDDDIPF